MSNNSEVTTALRLTAYDRMSQVVNTAMSKSMSAMNRFKKTADRIGGRGGTFGVGGAITAAGAFQFAKEAIEAFEKVEEAETQMEITFMKAGNRVDPMFEKLSKHSRDLAKVFKGGTASMMEMNNELVRSGVKANDVINGIGSKTAQFSTVMQIGYTEAAQTIGRLGTSLKLSGKDLEGFIDIMARTRNMGINNFEEIANAMKKSRINLFGQGGLQNAQGAAALITELTARIGDASQAGAAFQAVMVKAMDKKNVAALNAALPRNMSVQFTDKSGKFLGFGNMVAQLGQLKGLSDAQKVTLLQKYFGGRRGFAAAAGMMNMGGSGFNAVMEKMMGQASVSEKAAKIQAHAGYQMEIAWSRAKETLVKIGGELMPVFEALITQTRRIIENFREWYDKNKFLGSIIKWVTVTLVGLKAVMFVSNFLIGGMFRSISTLIGGLMNAAKFIKATSFAIQYYLLVVKSWTIWSKLAAAGQWLMNTAFLGCPVIWIIAGIVAIVAAVVLLVKYWKPVTAFFSKTWEGIKGVFNKFNTWFKGWGKYIILPLAPFIAVPLLIMNNWSTISEFFGKLFSEVTGIFNKVVGWFGSIGSKFFNAGKNIVKSIWEGIKSFANKPIEAITNIVKKIRDFLPFSPAKMGPLKDLHRVKIMETIAATIKPMPIVKAMNSAMGGLRSQSAKIGGGGGGSTFTFAPVITISGAAGANAKNEMITALKSQMPEFMRMIREEQRKIDRRTY